MLTLEGRGFLVRTGADTPWALALGLRQLDVALAIQAAPWPALESLLALAGLLPGGFHLLWDAPADWVSSLPGEAAKRLPELLGSIPGLELHLQEPTLLAGLQAPRRILLHAPLPPREAFGHAWRQGAFTWVPEAGATWSLPGFGRVAPQEDPDFGESVPASYLWGEAVLPLGALAHFGGDELALALQGAQARLERALSHRLTQGAWLRSLPFQRRRTGWRLAFLGGREYAASGGTWEESAERIRHLADFLRDILKVPILCGPSNDAQAASLLGHQAMREGHPWRYSLPIPPASPTFSPGLGADAREISAPEARAAFPLPLAEVLEHPPLASLRVPCMPQERTVEVFLRSLQRPPALRWLPPEAPPPGPFLSERPWHPPHLYPALADPATATQQALFEDLE